MLYRNRKYKSDTLSLKGAKRMLGIKVGDYVRCKLSNIKMLVFTIDSKERLFSIRCRWLDDEDGKYYWDWFMPEELTRNLKGEIKC